MLKEKLKILIQQAVGAAFSGVAVDPELAIPANLQFGDFSTNAALILAKSVGQKPRDVAQKIAEGLKDEEGLITRTEIAGPGFINFFLNPQKWIEGLSEIAAQKKQYGENKKNAGKKALVELVSANPTGPLHVGNARGGPLGDAIASLLSAEGYEVTREYYLNNVGGQIDKLGESILHVLAPLSPSLEKIQYQGGYVDELAKKAAEKFSGNLPAKKEEAIQVLGNFGITELEKEIRADCEKMGIRFDSWVCESDIREGKDRQFGKATTVQVLAELEKKGVTRFSEGAVWLAINDEYLSDRECVLKKSDGSPTYFTNDIAYHVYKYERKFDRMINVWGSNHHGHVPRIQAALKALGYNPEQLETVLYQYVRIKRGNEAIKMSKRGGNFVTAREILEEVGCDAFRFFLLLRSPEAHLDFDLELATKQDSDNPVYYVQYAHARICSIFEKAKTEGKGDGLWPVWQKSFAGLLDLPEEIFLSRFLASYPEIVEKAAESFAPHRIAHYVMELARHFQSYYDRARGDERYRVLAGNPETVSAKLFLLGCVRQVLQNALQILGVSAPEKM